MRSYSLLKPLLQGRAAYLDAVPGRRARVLLVRMRTGAHSLRSDSCHWERPAAGPGCTHCLAPVEDERHFMLHCPAYGPARQALVSCVPGQ